MGALTWLYALLMAVLMWLWRWGRVLWVCRVSALSAIGGGLFVAFTPQALDLFADTGLTWRYWLVFFILLFGWAWVVHTMARRALQYDDWICEARRGGGVDPERREELRAEFGCAAVVVPRALGIAVFVAIAGALIRAYRNLAPAANGLAEAAEARALIVKLLIVTILLGIVFMLAVWKRRKVRASLSGQLHSEPALLNRSVPLLAQLLQPRKHATWPKLKATTWFERGLLIAWGVVTAIFIVALVNPTYLAVDWLPRALFIPVLVGGGVLLFGEIAALSHRWETPLIVVLVAIGAGLTYVSFHYNDVRWTTSPEASAVVGGPIEIGFKDAVDRWKAANGCSADANACPAPIVVAGAGGASRAAFQTATVIGAILDLPKQHPNLYDKELRNRIFALSTVSGSSVGAVIIRAALSDAAEAKSPDTPPCIKSDSGAWFGVGTGRNAATSWRDCFQQLLAGDFLSPVMVGLAYRDNFPLGMPFSGRAAWSDRGVLLEQAFERRYFAVTGKGASACTDKSKDDGLCRRFGHHPDPRAAGAWLPLLFINGSSVSTGRRILTSDVSAADNALASGAYDIQELRASRHADKPDKPREEARDMFLSSAALMSCRFPLISPHGIIRDRTGYVADRIVDGGYFENDGLATAKEVAQALINAGLHPVVLRVVNDPLTTPPADRTIPGRKDITLPTERQAALFDVYTSIVRGLLSTRSGHEDAYEGELKTTLEKDNDPLIEVGVRPLENRGGAACRSASGSIARMDVVSMSWWMSQPVQAYLDAQLCVKQNWSRLDCALKHKTPSAIRQCLLSP